MIKTSACINLLGQRPKVALFSHIPATKQLSPAVECILPLLLMIIDAPREVSASVGVLRHLRNPDDR